MEYQRPRTVADDLRDHPKPVDPTPHEHFHEHIGYPRHAHSHIHFEGMPEHAHSTLLNPPQAHAEPVSG